MDRSKVFDICWVSRELKEHGRLFVQRRGSSVPGVVNVLMSDCMAQRKKQVLGLTLGEK